MAPPGLKGYMGAEYWNAYWKQAGVVARTGLRASDLAAQGALGSSTPVVLSHSMRQPRWPPGM